MILDVASSRIGLTKSDVAKLTSGLIFCFLYENYATYTYDVIFLEGVFSAPDGMQGKFQGVLSLNSSVKKINEMGNRSPRNTTAVNPGFLPSPELFLYYSTIFSLFTCTNFNCFLFAYAIVLCSTYQLYRLHCYLLFNFFLVNFVWSFEEINEVNNGKSGNMRCSHADSGRIRL